MNDVALSSRYNIWLNSTGCKLVLTARRTERLEKLAKDLHDKYKVRHAVEDIGC